MRCYNIISLLLLLCLVPVASSFAASWTQSKNHSQLIFSVSDYRAHDSSDLNNFSKYEINPFFEYGLTSDLTIGANPILQHWQSKQPSGNTNGEMFESEFFVRKKLFENNNTVFSVQPLIKIPCVTISGNNDSCDSYDIEIRALAGYSFQIEKQIKDDKIRPFSGQHHFIDIETAYRKHTDKSSDLVKIDGTAGFRFNENILLLGQFFSSIATNKEPPLDNLQTSTDRYANLKLQLSGVLQTSKTTSIQIGVYDGLYSEVSNNQLKSYQGIMLSLWKGF